MGVATRKDFLMNHSIRYKNYQGSDVSPLIISINMMGDNLVGLELGVFRAESFMTILHNCDNVKKLIGVDHWRSYTDFIKTDPDGQPAMSIDDFQAEANKNITLLHCKYGTPKNKQVNIIAKDSLEAVKEIKDESLDFIFFNAMLNKEQTYNEAMAYYPKIKKDGYFTGHDSQCIEQVMEPINKVKKHFNNTNKMISYGNCFIFKK